MLYAILMTLGRFVANIFMFQAHATKWRQCVCSFTVTVVSIFIEHLHHIIQQTEHRPFNCVGYADCRMR